VNARRTLQQVSVRLIAIAVCALGGNSAFAQPGPTPTPVRFPARLTLGDGPTVVPDNTRYEYKTNCPVDADWTVGAPGSPSTGKGRNLTIAWGAGSAQTTIDIVCGKLTKSIPVEVVDVRIDKSTATLGGGAFVRDHFPLRIADTSRPKPAITFTADLTVTGPIRSPHWGKKIVTGFVQRLVAADSTQWVARYAGGAPPNIKQNSLNADTARDPPPKADCVGVAQTCPSWYASGAAFTFAPSANGPGHISINDSPSPGWWLKDHKTRGLDLDEAHALWKFETYVCVQSLDKPNLFFRRAVATWQIEVGLDSNSHATAKVTPNPVQLTADVSDDPGKCEPLSGAGVNFWLNDIVTFR
jgi:hypothetical protein